MKNSKFNYSKNISDTKEIKDTLLKFANKSNDEIIQNKMVKCLIQFKQKEIDQNKRYISILSSSNTKENIKLKKELENKVIKDNQKLFETNELIKKEINILKEKYKTNSNILNNSIKQQNNVLEAIKETNFLLENKLKEKESLISRIKELICDITLNIGNFEVIKDIDKEFYRNIDEYNNKVYYNLLFNREYYHEYLLYKSIKFNKIKNKVFKLTEKKKELENYNNGHIQSKTNLSNKNNEIAYNNSYIEEIKEEKIKKNKYNSSNDMIIPTNITTDESILSLNDSLYFDTEEQIDVELPENDFSSYFLSQKSLGFKIIKKEIIIPKLELNKIKELNINDDNSSKEISLSRSFEDDIKHKIKKIKKQIKLYETQNKNLDKKCEKFENKIKQIALFVYSNKKFQ